MNDREGKREDLKTVGKVITVARIINFSFLNVRFKALLQLY